MDTETEIRRAWSAYNSTLDAIRKAKPGAGAGLEAVYGQTYQRLVMLGVRPQIKKKYRR